MEKNLTIFKQHFDRTEFEKEHYAEEGDSFEPRTTSISVDILIQRLGTMINRENGAVVSALQAEYFRGFVWAYVEMGLMTSEEAKRIIAHAQSIFEAYEVEASLLDEENKKKKAKKAKPPSIPPLGKIRL